MSVFSHVPYGLMQGTMGTAMRVESNEHGYEQSNRFVRSHLVWDNQVCLALNPFDEHFHSRLRRYRLSQVNIVVLNVGFGEHSIEEHIRAIAHFRHCSQERPDDYLLVANVADIHKAVREQKLGIIFNIEGARAIGDQLSLIALYYSLGVRWMLMVYNRRNLVGGGCHDDEDLGLTKFGRAVLDEMARVGLIACCSHTGPRTTLDILAYSSKPVIFSHSNPRALWDHPRNISDEAMLGCAATGGVVCINGVGAFLGKNDTRTETIVRHIDYVVSLIGVEHVGIGLDHVFDRRQLKADIAKMTSSFPVGSGYDVILNFAGPEQIPEIAEMLLRSNYKEADVAMIVGANLLRVAEQVWQ